MKLIINMLHHTEKYFDTTVIHNGVEFTVEVTNVPPNLKGFLECEREITAKLTAELAGCHECNARQFRMLNERDDEIATLKGQCVTLQGYVERAYTEGGGAPPTTQIAAVRKLRENTAYSLGDCARIVKLLFPVKEAK
jgi:hypothetical protein